VGAQASGQIRKIHVEAGDVVKEGQLLVEIDPSTQRPSSTPAASPSKTSRPSCRSNAPSTNWRARNTSASSASAGGATREEDVQTAKAELKATQARVDMFQAQIRQAQASLRSDRPNWATRASMRR
jgi:macrolide-specific efflux system membrane fusion protein